MHACADGCYKLGASPGRVNWGCLHTPAWDDAPKGPLQLSLHSVGFPGSCLPICYDGSIVALKGRSMQQTHVSTEEHSLVWQLLWMLPLPAMAAFVASTDLLCGYIRHPTGDSSHC